MSALDRRERAVLAAVEAARDRSVASPELAARVWADFPTLWELSPYRTTIFDALGLARAGTLAALELDAGLGAVTRWLGEHFGRVDAVEGSTPHAACAYARTSDLPSVSVFARDPAELEAEATYDLVTLAGGAVDAARLRVARRALRPEGGVAVVTVANPYGLKYLNGARDETGTGAGGPDRTELEALVRAAGFDAVDVLLPFPDHVLTSTVVDPAAFDDDPDVANWLLGAAPNRAAGAGPRVAHVSETLAQRAVVESGLLTELSNALVLLCWRGDPARVAARLGLDRGWAARHWSLDRRAACRKRVTLTTGGAIVNALAAAGGPADRAARIDLGLFEHRLAEEPRRRGPLVAFAALEALVDEGAGPRLHALVQRYAGWLVDAFGTGAVDHDGVALLAGDALDAIWTNVIDDPAAGGWVAVDGEWAFLGSLPLDFVVWRALVDLTLRFPAEARAVDPYAIARACGVMAGEGRLALAVELQDAFHAAAGTGATPTPGPRVQALADATPGAGRRFRVLARAEEVIASPALLKAYAKAFAGAALATLVLFSAEDASASLPALRDAIVAADLDEDTMPDTVLVSGDAAQDGDAVLGTSDWGPPRLRRFGPDDVVALRALAEHRWSGPSERER